MLQGQAGSWHMQDRHRLRGWARGNFPASSVTYSSKPEPKSFAIIWTLESCARAESCFGRAAWGNPQNFPQSVDYACTRHVIDSHTERDGLFGQSQECHHNAAVAMGYCSAYSEK